MKCKCCNATMNDVETHRKNNQNDTNEEFCTDCLIESGVDVETNDILDEFSDILEGYGD